MIPASLSPLADHLWQSTLFVGMVWILTLVLRRNQAQVRYWLWLAASVKFLVPFALFVAIGTQVPWRSGSPVPQPQLAYVIDVIGQPFSSPQITDVAPQASSSSNVAVLPLILLATWLAGCGMHLLAWWIRWRRVAAIARDAVPLENGRELAILRRLEDLLGVRRSTPLVSTDTTLEPAAFGVWKPVLLWPRHFSDRLVERQIEAILLHELSHIRRRDNLAIALHMCVEAIFWFHPVVWWIERRLIDERERACDEEVVRLGSDPELYAESILKTCEYYAESPLVCVSGVTGSDLKRRVEAIMRSRAGVKLDKWKKLMLTAVATVTLALPIGIGLLTAPPLRAEPQSAEAGPAFEVASIRPWRLVDRNSREARLLANGADPSSELFTPIGTGRYTATAITLRGLIATAYGLRPNRISGGHEWIDSERYSVEAKAEDGAILPGEMRARVAQLRLMLQNLLANRFQLRMHHDAKVFDVYALGVANNGPKLQKSDRDCSGLAIEPGACHSSMGGPGRGLTARGVDMADLARTLTLVTDRPVVDATRITGLFDIQTGPWNPYLNGAPEGAGRDRPAAEGGPVDFSTLPTIFTLLREELGLRLEPTRAPLDIIVIDSVERPTEDADLSDSPAQTRRVRAEPVPEIERVEAEQLAIRSQLAALQSSTEKAAAERSRIARPVIFTQSSAGQSGNPVFEVASIKPQERGVLGPPRVGFSAGGRFEAIGATLHDLIAISYGEFSRPPQIIGGPSWIKDTRFDVAAKAESSSVPTSSGPPGPESFAMVRALLAERFKLVTHAEMRQLPIYALVLVARDGQLGPQLRRAADCTVSNPPGPVPLAPGQINPCGVGRYGPGRIAGRGVPLAPLVGGSLANLVGRVVVDRTGLAGFFDWDLEWAPTPGEPPPPPSDGAAAPQPINEGPSIFTALQEQLGLKLESTSGPVEVLIIDSVERPTPD